jgi:hypothetical protein
MSNIWKSALRTDPLPALRLWQDPAADLWSDRFCRSCLARKIFHREHQLFFQPILEKENGICPVQLRFMR